jgi:hypothetical protein
MTTPSQQPIPPIVPVVADELADDPDRSTRDSDGTPVGRDDLRADVERSGGDPDDV